MHSALFEGVQSTGVIHEDAAVGGEPLVRMPPALFDQTQHSIESSSHRLGETIADMKSGGPG